MRLSSAEHFSASDLMSMLPCMGIASKTPISNSARVAAMVYACELSVGSDRQVRFG